MDTKPRYADITRSFEDFQPPLNWVREDKSDTAVIDLPGFSKWQLRVQLDNHRNMKISGERPIEGNRKWSRFRMEFRIPDHSNANQIQAKFESGALYIVFPKANLTAPVQETIPLVPSNPQKAPAVEPTPKKSDPQLQKTKPDSTTGQSRVSAPPKLISPAASAGLISTARKMGEVERKVEGENKKDSQGVLPKDAAAAAAQEMKRISSELRLKSNGFSVGMRKEEESRGQPVGDQSESFGQERGSDWYGRAGGLMMMLHKYKPSKFALGVVVGVAIGYGLFEAYRSIFPAVENGVLLAID